jgi:hypothetical protein
MCSLCGDSGRSSSPKRQSAQRKRNLSGGDRRQARPGHRSRRPRLACFQALFAALARCLG